MGATKPIDWQALEGEYRMGDQSLRGMASRFGLSHVAIVKHARKDGWIRNNKPKIITPEVKKAASPNPADKRVDIKRGAPTKKTAELLDQILCAILQGNSTRQICDKLGIARRTMWNWLAKDRTLVREYALAKEFYATILVDEIIEIADGTSSDTYINAQGRRVGHEPMARTRLRIKTRQWCAIRLAPKKYGNQIENVCDERDLVKSIPRVELVFVDGSSKTQGDCPVVKPMPDSIR